ncbi:hypothetical protein AgCh_013802 [Apium graveolens]
MDRGFALKCDLDVKFRKLHSYYGLEKMPKLKKHRLRSSAVGCRIRCQGYSRSAAVGEMALRFCESSKYIFVNVGL